MKKFIWIIVGCLLLLTSCNDYETYGEKKDTSGASLPERAST